MTDSLQSAKRDKPDAKMVLDMYADAVIWLKAGKPIMTEPAVRVAFVKVWDALSSTLAALKRAEARVEALEASLARNIRERCIRMIDDGYPSPEEQQPFFPDVPRSILDAVFTEPFVATLAAAGSPNAPSDAMDAASPWQGQEGERGGEA